MSTETTIPSDATSAITPKASAATAAASASAVRRAGSGPMPKAEVPAEMTLLRLEELLLQTEGDDGRFLTEAMLMIREMTGARSAILFGIDADAHPEVLAMARAENVPAGIASEVPVQQGVANTFNSGSSQRIAVPLSIGKVALLCVPFTAPDGNLRVISLLIGEERRLWLEPNFTMLHLFTQIFERRGRKAEVEKMQTAFMQSTLLIDLFSRAALARDFSETVNVICSELREFIGCGRVAIGLQTSSGNIKLEGVSGTTQLEARSQGNSLLRGAMRECIGVDKPVFWPPEGALESDGIWPAGDQQELAQCYEASQILTAPLRTEEGEVLGAWTFLWHRERGVSDREKEIITAAEPHLAALVDLAKRGKPRGLLGAWRRFKKTATRFKKVAVFGLPILLTALMFVPVRYKVGADVVLQPTIARQVAAPFDGTLAESLVKPGEPVEQGQLLARLDGKEVRWQLSEAIAKRESALKKRDQALEAKDVSSQQMAQLEADAAGLDVSLLEYQKVNLEIISPIKGFVISGNLDRSEGVPVSTGQKLFEIAPTEKMRAEIAVLDSEINHVREKMEVEIRLESRAGEKLSGEIIEIFPISESFDGENVFFCLADVDADELSLRPGMRGRAKIDTANKAIGWVLFHKPWDWIRLNLW